MSENRKLYLAYGSNLDEAQMAWRCPDAKVVGKAVLKDWKLVFKVHATIEPCKGFEVPVLVWEISDSDEASLDAYESYPAYYEKQNLDVTVTDMEGGQTEATAMVYVMTGNRKPAVPAQFYYQIIYLGYCKFHFDLSILRKALLDSAVAASKH